MRQKMNAQKTIDEHNFLEMGDIFSEDAELTKISAALDEAPEILAAVTADLRSGLSETGAEGMTVEQVLRSAILYQLRCDSYRELEARLGSDYNFRKFSRFYAQPIPHFSCLEKAIKRLRAETFEQLNELVVAYAVKKKLEDGGRVRADTAVAETNIHHPTDASLLWDCARRLDRLMRGARTEFPQCRFEYHNRTKRVKKLAYQITMAKNNQAKANRRGWYRELLKLVREVAGLARACRAALSREELSLGEDPYAGFFRSELDHFLALTEQCVMQCERRVIAEEKVPAGEKVVSIFEPHTAIIRRGKTQSPTEFGHKVAVVTGAAGLVLQYKVCAGNPADHELLAEMLEQHAAQFGAGPAEFTADRRFYHEDNEPLAAPYGVERLAIPKPGRRSEERITFEKQPWFKRLLRFRAGIEGNLSTLLRCFGLGRCLWRGLESFKAWVGLSCFTWNLKKIAALT
jgi:IS5 family transposase